MFRNARKRHFACCIRVLIILVSLVSLHPGAFAQAPRNVDAATSADGGGGDVDVTAIVRETETNGSAMHKRLLDYTYTQERTLDSGNKFCPGRLKQIVRKNPHLSAF